MSKYICRIAGSEAAIASRWHSVTFLPLAIAFFTSKTALWITIHLWVLAECAAIRMKQSGRGLLALQTSNNGGNRLCFRERRAGRLLNVPRAPISHYEMPLGFYGCHKSD